MVQCGTKQGTPAWDIPIASWLPGRQGTAVLIRVGVLRMCWNGAEGMFNR